MSVTQADREAARNALNFAFRNAEIRGDFELADLSKCFADYREAQAGLSLDQAAAECAKHMWGGRQHDINAFDRLPASEQASMTSQMRSYLVGKYR